MSLPSSMADFAPSHRLLQKACKLRPTKFSRSISLSLFALLRKNLSFSLFQICCWNTLYNKLNNLQTGCCGKTLIFTSHQLCCLGQVTNKPAGVQNPSCCGRQGYNPATQVNMNNSQTNSKSLLI